MSVSCWKPFARASRRPSRSKTAASAVENQVVVATHLVHIRHWKAIFLGHVAKHALPQNLLAGDEGRRRKIHYCLRARFGQHLDWILMIPAALPEIPVVPDVLADADAQAPAVQLQDLRTHGRLEIAVFIEDIVGGEQGLVKRGTHIAILEQHRAIEQRPAHFRRIGRGHSHQKRGRRCQLRSDFAERLAATPHESLVHQKIARQVSHQRQLRRDYQIGAFILDLPGAPNDE